MIWVSALATAAGLAVAFFQLVPIRRAPAKLSPLDDRMTYYGSSPEAVMAQDAERESFAERILDPLAAQLTMWINRFTPAQQQERLDQTLAAAGNPYGLDVVTFVAVRLGLAAVGLALGISIGYFAGNVLVGILAAMVGALAAWYLFGWWLSSQVRERRRKTLLALPNVVDFLVVAVDAGLTFDVALSRVIEKYHNPLTDAIAVAVGQVQLGAHRLDALEDFARRSEVPEVSAFVQTVVGSERMGVPIARTLRIQAADLRWRRAEWARTRGSRAAVRMTLPMVFLVFPTLWLILLGPSFIAILQRGL